MNRSIIAMAYLESIHELFCHIVILPSVYLVYRFGFGAVMPMMDLGRCENISEPSESKTKVGMDEDGMQGDKNDVRNHREIVKAENERWDIDQ